MNIENINIPPNSIESEQSVLGGLFNVFWVVGFVGNCTAGLNQSAINRQLTHMFGIGLDI
jgi:hypothetical protein